MFQFPGFALLTLCVQVKSTWVGPFIGHTVAGSRNKSSRCEAVGQIKNPSGGFPHSDIPGSKGALASPGLIAECHVLHRLLLPRHPPNALIALDPIQKKTGPFVCGGSTATRRQRSGRKSLTLGPSSAGPAPGAIPTSSRGSGVAVSVYRLGKTVLVVLPSGRLRTMSPMRQTPDASRPPLGPDPERLVFCSLNDVMAIARHKEVRHAIGRVGSSHG